MQPKTIWFSAVAIGTIVLDQATKIWIVQNLRYQRDSIDIIPGWLQLVHVQNPGAAFGMMRDSPYRMWLFLAFTIVAIGLIINLFRQLEAKDRFMSIILGLIMGGAIGNGIDRAHKQSVTDFVRVYTDHPELKQWMIENLNTYEYPSFNVADSGIVVGVALFLIHYVFFEDRDAEEAVDLSSDSGDPTALDAS